MQNLKKQKQGEEKYESSFIANIFNAEGDNFVGRISEKTITNSDGSKTKIAEIYNPNTNSYIALTPGFNYSKIADKKNEIKPRYFTYNGEVDIEYIDTDGQTKTLKPNDSFRVEGPNSPQALINLSKTQDAEEKKLIGDKGFASRPLVDINNPGIVVASINGIIGGTGNYEESIQMRENFEIPYKDENNVDQFHTYQAGESINNRDERFMPLLNLLQETTIGNISEMRKAGFISAPKLLEQRNDLLQQGQSINALINYVDTIDQTSAGINRTIDRVNTWFTNTFMPENQLDENEVALRIANGQLSRLGGTQRVDILGPGVMTEFDFLRLQEALGGEPTSKQSIQAFKRTLKLILEEKMVKYNDSLKVYDAQRTKFGDLRAEVIPPINFEVKEYKSFFEPTDYPSWNTGMIKRIEKGDAIFNQIAEVQKLVGTNATNEDYLKFFNKKQWEEIKARLRLLGIKGVPK
jgi:predicted SnoaL-like aldol condensation-catalyzing enzyme